jgi:hypothetical protein
VGTHALVSESVRFADLGLAVIDEQHRFGVEQRGLLDAKAGGGRAPHVLLMTATPIPRTLGQVLYADLDVSDVRSVPTGRPKVTTGMKATQDLASTRGYVRREAAAGHRTFVVAPLIGATGAATADGTTDDPDRAGLVVGIRAADVQATEQYVTPLRRLTAEAVPASTHVTALVSGQAAANQDLSEFGSNEAERAERTVLPFTFGALLLAFGALGAAGLPLVAGIGAVTLALGRGAKAPPNGLLRALARTLTWDDATVAEPTRSLVPKRIRAVR